MRASLSGGSELLMGLFGPGDFVSGHPTDMGSTCSWWAHSTAPGVRASVERRGDNVGIRASDPADAKLSRHLVFRPFAPKGGAKNYGDIDPSGRAFRAARRGWLGCDRYANHASGPCKRGVRKSAHGVHDDARALSHMQVVKFQGAGDHRRIYLNSDRARDLGTRWDGRKGGP